MRKCFVWFLILALWTMPWAVQAEQDSPLVVRGYGFDPYMIPAFMSDHPEIPLVIDNDFSVSRTRHSKPGFVDRYLCAAGFLECLEPD